MVTKIMPLGASNTYGMYQNPSSPGGYRGPLQTLLKDRYSTDFVGLDRDGAIADPDHNGYSGKTIDWFTRPINETIRDRDGSASHTINSGTKTGVQYFIERAGMQSDDVVLLLAGTNDVRLGDSAEKMIGEMKVLLDQIVNSSASPFVQLMKLQPVGGDLWTNDGSSRTNNDTIRLFNEGVQKMVTDTYAAKGVTFVDSGVTTSDLSSDKVHMNATGYSKMASAYSKSLVAKDQLDLKTTTTTPTQPTTGDDTISVRITGDAWKGDPVFDLLVNGKVVKTGVAVTADRVEGEWDTFTFRGDFNLDGTDRVGVRFTNNLNEGTGRDRNLYVDQIVLDGQVNGIDQKLLYNTTAYWDF